jgi:hypothetical protein
MTFDADDVAAWGFSALAGTMAILAMARANGRGELGWARAGGIVLVASAAVLLAACAIVFARGHYHVGHGGNSPIVLVFFAVILVMQPLTAWLVVGVVTAGILKFKPAKPAHTDESPS